MSAAVLTHRLPTDSQKIWNQRDKMHSIILIDWDPARQLNDSNGSFHTLREIILYVR